MSHTAQGLNAALTHACSVNTVAMHGRVCVCMCVYVCACVCAYPRTAGLKMYF